MKGRFFGAYTIVMDAVYAIISLVSGIGGAQPQAKMETKPKNNKEK